MLTKRHITLVCFLFVSVPWLTGDIGDGNETLARLVLINDKTQNTNDEKGCCRCCSRRHSVVVAAVRKHENDKWTSCSGYDWVHHSRSNILLIIIRRHLIERHRESTTTSNVTCSKANRLNKEFAFVILFLSSDVFPPPSFFILPPSTLCNNVLDRFCQYPT